MLGSAFYYLLLPLGAAYAPELFAIRIYGSVNLGLVFALSEFVVAWSVALIYTRRATRDFDRAAEEISRDALVKYLIRRS